MGRKFTAPIRRTLAAVAIAMPALAHGDDLPAALAPLPVPALANLKAEALGLQREALALEQALLPADAGDVTVYVGNRINGLLLRYVSVRIDGEPAQEHEYSDTEATSLQSGGLHRVLAAPLAQQGTHRLRAHFVAAYADDKPGEPQIRGQIEETFKIGAVPSLLELDVVKGSFGKHSFKLREWSPAQ
jgi:hypothetical protein